MNYLIGIDLGTQGTKAILRDECGVVCGEAFEASELQYPEPGAVEQDPEAILASVLRTIRSVVDESGIAPSAVAGICLAGQMAGILGIDRDGRAMTPYDSWLDTRCGTYRSVITALGEEKVIAITGAPVTYAHGPKIVWWKHERPETYKRIYKFIQPAAYCVLRMCGLNGDDAFIDHTYLHFAGFADTEKRQWSGELLHALAVDPDKMPRIVKPQDVMGALTDAMADSCGLQAGIPMVAGCGDTAASIFGSGVFRSGLLLDVAGTASVLACATEDFAPDTEHKTIMFPNSVLDGIYTPMAYINGGGMCLKWLRDDILGERLSFSQLDAMAEQVAPGSEDLLFLPHFSGRVCPNDTLVRGSYTNLGWNHGTAHLYRAILEGIAYEYGIYKEIIHQLVPDLDFKRVISVGGGSKSALFGQIKADVLDTEVATINLADTSVLACCSIAGYGVGLYDSMTSLIEKTVETRGRIEPDAQRHAFYDKRRKIYATVFSALHDVQRDLQELEPWQSENSPQ